MLVFSFFLDENITNEQLEQFFTGSIMEQLHVLEEDKQDWKIYHSKIVQQVNFLHGQLPSEKRRKVHKKTFLLFSKIISEVLTHFQELVSHKKRVFYGQIDRKYCHYC